MFLEFGIDDVGFQKSFSGKQEVVLYGHAYKVRFNLVGGKLKKVNG
jgi:hypothetical protein